MHIFRKWTHPKQKPPFGAEVDWSDPITEGLVGCWLFNEYCGRLVSPFGQCSAGYHSGLWCPIGLDLTNNTYFDVQFPGFVERSVSLLCDGIFQPDNVKHCICGNTDLVFKWCDIYNHLVVTVPGAVDIVSSLSSPSGKGTVGYVLTPSSVIFYCNGYKQVAFNASWKGSGIINLTIGESGAGWNEFFHAIFRHLFLWFRSLSDSEIERLYHEPYSFFLAPFPWFMIDLAAGTLTSGLSWKIFDRKQIDLTWKIFDRQVADLAYKILGEQAQQILYRILDRKEQSIEYKILTESGQTVSWKIFTEASQDLLWKIFALNQQDIVWAILNAGLTSADLSWKILALREGPLAYKIFAAEDAPVFWKVFNRQEGELSWHIFAVSAQDLAWAIMNATQSEIFWKIFAQSEHVLSWKIFASSEQDLEWKVFAIKDEQLFWAILAETGQDLNWKIFTATEQELSWAVISERVPEPVAVFVARTRPFIINVKSKTLIFKA